MNENIQEQQLTRRQLRELAAQQNQVQQQEYSSTETAGLSVYADPSYNEAQLAIVAQLTEAVHVERLGADGVELSRRQYRNAREAEYNRLLAEWESQHGPLLKYGVADEGELNTAVAAEQATGAEVADDAAVDSAAQAAEIADVFSQLPVTEALPVNYVAEEDAAAADGQGVASGGKKRWNFGRKKAETDAAVVQPAADEFAHGAEQADAVTAETADSAQAQLLVDSAGEPSSVPVYTSENEIIVPAVEDAQLEAEAEILAAGQAAAEAEQIAAGQAAAEAEQIAAADQQQDVEYSFPDISPLGEDVPVIDQQPNTTGEGFDSLISRAVAEETSSSVKSNTAALILPSMPHDAILASALDAESGVFVSGSIQVSRSLAETGGHETLHGDDSDEKFVLDEVFETNSHTQPVSALRAVSSQHAQTNALLTESKQDTSKAPIVFMITGGVLVVAGGAVFIAAMNGMFG